MKENSNHVKKIRRGKKQKQIYSNMSFHYVNIDGLSQKRDFNKSSNMIISKCNPHIICLVETKLSHNVKVNISGYYIVKQRKNTLSGGIVIAVKEELSSK